jgi:predicted Fe-Mo cluster-binding NifX family protein
MKIAVVTDDGVALAQHFGRARYYHVFTVEDGVVVADELRDRTGTLHHGHGAEHDHGAGDSHGAGHGHGAHGMGAGASDRHAAMVSQLSDVETLVVGGMGLGARQAMAAAEISVVATDLSETRAAVDAFIAGTLTSQEDRFH